MTGFLPKSGGYRNLRAYQMSEAVFDLTVIFINRFIPAISRTCGQMEQAARSGKQNIAEGSAASATSKETEIKLTNVAKASLEELLLDYEDYLRQHGLQKWDKENSRIVKMRKYLMTEEFRQSPVCYADKYNDEEFCNLMITLINQTTFMLRKLIERQQQEFLENGGIKELMYRTRTEYRQNQVKNDDRTGRTSRTSQTSQTGRTLIGKEERDE